MTQGYVYILTNNSMPGLVKIGRTSRDVDLRASELWQTGVPTRFDVYASERTCDCVQLEAFMHGELRRHRVSKSREFFAIAPELALEKLRAWVIIQAGEWARETFDGVFVGNWQTAVSESEVQRLAAETKQPPRIVADAMELLTADELAPAIERARHNARQAHFETLDRIGIPEAERWEPEQ